MTTIPPPSFLPIPSPYLPSSPAIHSFVSIQRRAGLPWISTKNVISSWRLDQATQYEDKVLKSWHKRQRQPLFPWLGVPQEIQAAHLGQFCAGFPVVSSVFGSPYEPV